MKKRVLSVLVAALLLLTMLTACGSKTDKAMLGHRCMDLSLGFLICSNDLYFSLSASTILS